MTSKWTMEFVDLRKESWQRFAKSDIRFAKSDISAVLQDLFSGLAELAWSFAHTRSRDPLREACWFERLWEFLEENRLMLIVMWGTYCITPMMHRVPNRSVAPTTRYETHDENRKQKNDDVWRETARYSNDSSRKSTAASRMRRAKRRWNLINLREQYSLSDASRSIIVNVENVILLQRRWIGNKTGCRWFCVENRCSAVTYHNITQRLTTQNVISRFGNQVRQQNWNLPNRSATSRCDWWQWRKWRSCIWDQLCDIVSFLSMMLAMLR